jgi:hypothetical protein
MTVDGFPSIVTSILDAFIAIAGVSGGVYIYWKAVRSGPLKPEHIVAAMAVIFLAAAMIFAFTHFVKGK